jgi:hypothetical protein
MIRFLALKLISEDKTLIVKIGNVVFSSSNRVRLLTRLSGSPVLGLLGAVFSIFPYAIFMALIYFSLTENCEYDCDAYFQHLSKEVPVEIYAQQSSGHLVISENNDARQVSIYLPSKSQDEIIHINNRQALVTRSYKPSRKKAKKVTFS